MFDGAGGVAHVVEAVEAGDEIEGLAGGVWKIIGARGHEGAAVAYARGGGELGGEMDGFLVKVESPEMRVGIGLGHENGGSTETAADVGDGAAGF